MFDSITKSLGNPYFQNENAVLFKGDCVSLMRKLEKDIIPLTVTSPPYNIGKEYETILSLDAYLDWSTEWLDLVHTVTKNDGSFWLNLGYLKVEGRAKAMPLPYLLWDKVPFFLIQELVWNYGAGVAGKKFLSPRNEKFLWYVKNSDDYVFNLDDIRDPNVKYPNQKKNGKLRCNPLGKNPTDVWQIPKITSGKNRSSKERTKHPAQFPIELVSRIIKASSNVGDVVLDPFMGSGSTAVAAIRNKRKVIGFELNEEYLEIAANRILTEADIEHPPLFRQKASTSSSLVDSNQFDLC